MTDDIKKISMIIGPLLKEAGVVKSSVFGSRAKGNFRSDSDLDLLVEFGKNKSLLDLLALKRNLEKQLNLQVDVMTFRSLNSRMKKKLRKKL